LLAKHQSQGTLRRTSTTVISSRYFSANDA
jgi:hypothetical protein